MSIAPPISNPRYVIGRRLGGGAQGETWLATDTTTGREVAVKVATLSGMNDIKDVELWERETATLRALDHPSIPKVVDAFVEPRPPFDRAYVLVQTFVDGQSLASRIDAGERWTLSQLIDLLRQALTTLAYLHERTPPVVHRDLKPSNLVLDGRGRLWLIDFGAVQSLLPAAPTGGSTVVGTHGYMPPEQLVGRARPASDLFALGATLVHLASGHSPTALPVERMRLKYRHAVALPAPFCDFLDRLLEPMEEDRLGSAREALVALDRALAPPTPAPVPGPPWSAALRSVWRRRQGLLGTLAAIAVAVAGLWLIDSRRHRSTTPSQLSDARLPTREAEHGLALAGAETGGQIPVTVVAPGLPGLSFTAKSSHVMALGLSTPQYVLMGRLTYSGPSGLRDLRGQMRLLDPKGVVVDAGPVTLSCGGATLRAGELCDGGVDIFDTVAGVVARVELVFEGSLDTTPPTPEPTVPASWRISSPPDVTITWRDHGEWRRGYSMTAWVDLVFEHRSGLAMKYLEGSVRFANAAGDSICRTATRQFVGLDTMAFRPGDRSPVRITCLPSAEVRDTAVTAVTVDLQGFTSVD